mmetsp:Transcript_3210/g.4578  ORF Transcript_3210/g.4578 Transcript_3210/m.4578 type:complete len:84 (-) Transcript_3210:2380-2631(-)
MGRVHLRTPNLSASFRIQVNLEPHLKILNSGEKLFPCHSCGHPPEEQKDSRNSPAALIRAPLAVSVSTAARQKCRQNVSTDSM